MVFYKLNIIRNWNIFHFWFTPDTPLQKNSIKLHSNIQPPSVYQLSNLIKVPNDQLLQNVTEL